MIIREAAYLQDPIAGSNAYCPTNSCLLHILQYRAYPSVVQSLFFADPPL